MRASQAHNSFLEAIIWSAILAPVVVVLLLPYVPNIQFLPESNFWGVSMFTSPLPALILPLFTTALSYSLHRTGLSYKKPIAVAFFQRIRLLLITLISSMGLIYYVSRKVVDYDEERIVIVLFFFLLAAVGLFVRRPRRDRIVKPYTKVTGIYKVFFWGGYIGMNLWIIPDFKSAFIASLSYLVFLMIVLAFYPQANKPDE